MTNKSQSETASAFEGHVNVPDVPEFAYYRQPELWEMSRYQSDYDQRLRARVVASMIDPGVESILDVGCGNGFVTRHLNARQRVVGLDASPEALAHFDGKSVLGAADNLPFQKGEFEAVTCCEVLEHLPAEVFRSAVSELRRVARKYILVGVPYHEDLSVNMTRCGHCGTIYHLWLHRRSFRSPATVCRYFPEFAINASAFLGQRLEILSAAFRFVRKLAPPSARSDLARCPQCGAGQDLRPKIGVFHRCAQRCVQGLAWRMPKRRVPNWMIVLMERRAQS